MLIGMLALNSNYRRIFFGFFSVSQIVYWCDYTCLVYLSYLLSYLWSTLGISHVAAAALMEVGTCPFCQRSSIAAEKNYLGPRDSIITATKPKREFNPSLCILR